MGFIIDVTDRISVELRRESVILYVGTEEENTPSIEYSYDDVNAIIHALHEVKAHDRYKQHQSVHRQIARGLVK